MVRAPEQYSPFPISHSLFPIPHSSFPFPLSPVWFHHRFDTSGMCSVGLNKRVYDKRLTSLWQVYDKCMTCLRQVHDSHSRTLEAAVSAYEVRVPEPP